MKPNQRISLTKELVHRALIRLLDKNELHKISIRELCSIAGINRTTFYNHYGSQYDVLAEITDQYLQDISDTINITDTNDKRNVLERIALVFTYIEQNLEISKLLIHNNIDESFAQRLFSLPKIEDMLAETLKEKAKDDDYRDIVSFIIFGSYKLLQDWIKSTDRRSPYEMASVILRLAGSVCSNQE